MKSTLINVVAFQLGWLATVLAAANQLPWLSLVVLVVLLAVHFYWVADARKADIKLLSAAIVLGVIWDSLLMQGGWTAFSAAPLFGALVPYWMLVLWVLFATTLNHSLKWLKGRWWLAAVFGVLGGPLSYFAGQRLGALVLPELMPSLIAIALGWAVLTPLLLKLAAIFDTSSAQSAAHKPAAHKTATQEVAK